jgi:hypothetical protein
MCARCSSRREPPSPSPVTDNERLFSSKATREAARSALRAADARLNGLGPQEDAERLKIALTRIDESQRMAGQLNQDANSLAADAAKTINDVLGSTAKR